MPNFTFPILAFVGLVFWFSQVSWSPEAATVAESVYATEQRLGAPAVDHLPNFEVGTPNQPVSAERGKQLIEQGISLKGTQSKHFVCTSCHLTVQEDPDLTQPDPESRLAYLSEKGLPFLAGTTLYGVVNRRSYYNGDYEKKYGDLVYAARQDLREAIQLCATECAQGKPLAPIDLESVLAYLWTLELQLSDLKLSEPEIEQLQTAQQSGAKQSEALTLLRTKYPGAAGATFLAPPESYPTGYSEKGWSEDGRSIYELSCLHCHEDQRYSFFLLDNSVFSFRHLAGKIDQYNYHSIYHVIRYGTSPVPGKRAYMPHYPAERMSNQQVEALRTYIEARAKGD